MLTATALYRAALPRPHRRETLIRVFHGDTEVTPGGSKGVPITSGNVRASLNSRVTRVATFTTGPKFYPEAVDDLLSPYRATVQILTGIGYSDGIREIFPVFTGRIHDATQAEDDSVTFRADDLAADVIALRFERPQATTSGDSVVSSIQKFIAGVLPDAVFGTNDVQDQAAPNLIWDDDRGRALDELAASVKGRWYALGDGSFVVRRYPYEGLAPVISLADGEPDTAGGGLVSAATRSITRDGTANSITVISERIDGSGTVTATARNTNASSPTAYGDLYGRVSQIIRPQTPVGAGAAASLAERQLASSTALAQQWSANLVPDATLEPGDPVRVTYRGRSAIQVIDSLTLPLVTQGAMSVNMRSIVGVTEGVEL